MVKKIIILLLLTVAALGVILYSQREKITGPAEEITPKAATGNIDDVINALIAEIDDEQLTFNGIADDDLLLFADSQEIRSFSQSVDENEF